MMAETTEKPGPDQIRDWLDAVPDPEIPVISLVDLGVIRDIVWEGDTLVVSVTPTYSGCPATRIINLDIETALRDHGIDKLELRQQIAPPWTTDWISDKGRAALEAYGIAPPQPAGGPARCPQCQSDNLERLSQFGSTPCKAQWRCRDCLEPFDYFKCI
jgi:ring-1,2-phenylacetyl-CoA epoxidase subunit PaaD